jgi:hypothetical protein
MKKETVCRDNVMFFVIAVGMSMNTEYFTQAILDSFMQQSQFPTDNVGKPGYIRIDSSAIWEKGEDLWWKFVAKVRKERLLPKASYGFSSQTEFEGDFAERVTFKKEGYLFAFHIKKYERDAAYGFEIINPEQLEYIPEGELVGRVVYLTIKPEEKE